MRHDNEYEVDDYKEYYGSTMFKVDGTEREDDNKRRNEVPDLYGGIIGGLQDDADRDRYENEMAQYNAVLETMDTDLAECGSEAEELATVSRLTKHFLELGYFAHVVNEAAADATKFHNEQKNTPN